MGQSWKFDEVCEIVLVATKKGHSQAASAALAGIAPETISGWKRIAKDTLLAEGRANKYTRWYSRFLKAKGLAAAVQEESLFKAGKEGNVQAAVKWLERQCPEEWDKQVTVTVEGELSVSNKFAGESDEALRTGVQRALERALTLATSSGSTGDPTGVVT